MASQTGFMTFLVLAVLMAILAPYAQGSSIAVNIGLTPNGSNIMLLGGPIFSPQGSTKPLGGANVTAVVILGSTRVNVSAITDRNGNINASVPITLNLTSITNLLDVVATAIVTLPSNITGTIVPRVLPIPLLLQRILLGVNNVLTIMLTGVVGILG
ncbi:hypothetical protein M9H77_06232 [Catharanthus roseus]|uniref:Uncharacterized protein n=1 Tax=Catharanthus roseus TaxID=4058 RepID=A0ACC0BRU4_CATRO|nr:hypothetical protein M9H77_06232 [Catharanthus roseus]